MDVFVPVAEPDGAQRGQLCGRERLLCGEGIVWFPGAVGAPLAPVPAQRFHGVADARDVVILGNDKGDQGLPKPLPQDTQPPAIGNRSAQKGVFHGYGRAHGRIIGIPVKVGAPEAVEAGLVRIEGQHIALLPDAHAPVPGQHPPPAALPRLHTEALAGRGNLPEVAGRKLFIRHNSPAFLSLL